MAQQELTLQEKFQNLTGINVIDIEEYINNAEDKNEAFRNLQWYIPGGQYASSTDLKEGQEDSLCPKVKWFAEVLTEIASKCGISSSKDDVTNIDINDNGSTDDTEDKATQTALSEAYAILEYDSEDEEESSSY